MLINPKYNQDTIRSEWFMPEPYAILNDIEDVRVALEDDSWLLRRYSVKSNWIISLIDEIAADRYPYNSVVACIVRQRLGLSSLSYEEIAKGGTPLSALVYNAQNYRRSDKLRNDGFSPLSNQLLVEAVDKKCRILLSDGTYCSVRKVEGTFYAFKPRKRKYAVQFGSPAKLEDLLTFCT
jgi:hypothetical protein